MSRSLKLLLLADVTIRAVGLAAFTIFIGAIYKDTGRASSVGLIGLATAIPSLIVLAFANKLTDRFSALKLLRAVAGFRLVSLAGFALLPHNSILIMIAAGFQSLSHQVSVSTKMTLDSQYVDDAIRRKYLARKGMLNNVTIVCAPAAGGLLVGDVGYGSALLVLATLSLLTLTFLVSLPSSVPHQAFMREAAHGLRASIRSLLSLGHVTAVVGLYCAMVVLLGMQAPLIFPFVHEVYSAGASLGGILLGLAGLGGLAGAYATERWPRLFSLSSTPWLVGLDGLVFFWFLQMSDLRVASILFASLGAMGSITLILVESVVQTEVKPSNRPFVFSLMQFSGGAGAASLGVAAAFLAERFSTKIVLSGAALLEIGMGTLCVIFLRSSLRIASLSAQEKR